MVGKNLGGKLSVGELKLIKSMSKLKLLNYEQKF